jgi:hypothetical protein
MNGPPVSALADRLGRESANSCERRVGGVRHEIPLAWLAIHSDQPIEQRQVR